MKPRSRTVYKGLAFLLALSYPCQPAYGLRASGCGYRKPHHSLRASVEGVQAGLEENLRPAPYPAVEVRNPERLASLHLKTVLWAFDGTVWKGYPHQAADRYFAQRLGLNVRNPSVMKAFHEFIQAASGLPWDEVKARLQARGWALSEEIAGEALMADVRNFVDEVVAREGRTDPGKYLIRGSRALLSALREARMRQAIVTGASAESRRRYAVQLGIWPFFDDIYGEGQKEAVVQREMEMQGSDPDRLVLIADGPRDMEIARRLGILAVGYAATPEARAAFLALPEELQPDVILNGDYQAVDWILSTLRMPDLNRRIRLENYEHQFLEDLVHPQDPPRVYSLYITGVVKAKRWRRDEREHHAGVLLSLTPYDAPIGFLPIANTFQEDGGTAWVGQKVELLYRLKEAHQPVQVAVEREGKKYRPGKMDFVFRAVRPWSRTAVAHSRHHLEHLNEQSLQEALRRGVSIPVAVRRDISESELEAAQAQVLEMIADLLRGSPHFSGRSYPYFRVVLEGQEGPYAPKLFITGEKVGVGVSGQAIALHEILRRVFRDFAVLAGDQEEERTLYEGMITLRLEQIQGYLVLELADNGPGIPAETLGQFFHDLLGDPPDQRLSAYGKQIMRRYSGQIEVDTRPRERDAGAHRMVYNPASQDVQIKALRAGARQGIGTTVRWTVSLQGPDGDEAILNAGLEEGASGLQAELERRLGRRLSDSPVIPEDLRVRELPQAEADALMKDKSIRLVMNRAGGIELAGQRPARILELTFEVPVRNGWKNSERAVAYYHLPGGLAEGQRVPVVVIPSAVHLDSFARAASIWLASRGIAVLELSLPVHGPRSPPDLPERTARLLGRPVELAAITTTDRYAALELQPGDYKTIYLQAVAELQAAVSWLLDRPEVDPARIGVAGQSLTGMLAHFAYDLDPRISRLISVAPVVSFGESFWHARGQRYDRLREVTGRLGWDSGSFIPVTALLDLRNSASRSAPGRGFLVTAKGDEVITDRQVQGLLVQMGVGGTPWESFIRWDLSVPEATSPHLELFLQHAGRILDEAAHLMSAPPAEPAAGPSTLLGTGGSTPLTTGLEEGGRVTNGPPVEVVTGESVSLGAASIKTILAIAREVGADHAFAVPLGPARSEPVTLQPFLYGQVEDRAAVEEYLANAGPILAVSGFRLAPLREGLPEPSDGLSLVIHEGDLPVPVQAATFQAAQVSARHRARLHPLLVAARALDPRLSWDFLKGFQPLEVLVLEDEASQTRYLVILA